MLRETEVSIGYGPNELDSLLSVTCTSRQSEVYVHVAPGTKPPAEAPVLVVKEGEATNTIKLEVYVCGQPAGCSNKPDGDVATYVAQGQGEGHGAALCREDDVSRDRRAGREGVGGGGQGCLQEIRRGVPEMEVTWPSNSDSSS